MVRDCSHQRKKFRELHRALPARAPDGELGPPAGRADTDPSSAGGSSCARHPAAQRPRPVCGWCAAPTHIPPCRRTDQGGTSGRPAARNPIAPRPQPGRPHPARSRIGGALRWTRVSRPATRDRHWRWRDRCRAEATPPPPATGFGHEKREWRKRTPTGSSFPPLP